MSDDEIFETDEQSDLDELDAQVEPDELERRIAAQIEKLLATMKRTEEDPLQNRWTESGFTEASVRALCDTFIREMLEMAILTASRHAQIQAAAITKVIDDVNAGRIDDLIKPRLDALRSLMLGSVN